MGTLVANIAKGRVAELHNRVKVGDPAAARLYAIPVSRGSVTDAQLADADDFAAIITLGVTERTTGGWNRKTLAAADLTAIAPDDTNDRMAADFIDLVWTAVSAGAVTDIIVCYSATASPTNGQLIPLTVHDFPITPDGSDVTATVTDYYRAT